MLNVLEPFACIARAIVFSVYSFTMSFVVFPFSLINISVRVNKPASTIGPVFFPVTFIKCEIIPDLFTSSIAHAIAELTDISDAITHIYGSLGHELCLILIIVFEGA